MSALPSEKTQATSAPGIKSDHATMPANTRMMNDAEPSAIVLTLSRAISPPCAASGFFFKEAEDLPLDLDHYFPVFLSLRLARSTPVSYKSYIVVLYK